MKLLKEKIKLIKKCEYFKVENDALPEVLKAVKYAIAAQSAAASSAGG